MKIPLPKATAEQIKYIESLLIDCGFSGERQKRNYFLTRVCSRQIHYLDELYLKEASAVIDSLLLMKGDQPQ